jgi:Zn-dependent peptidase ImmA (M78 family)
LGPDVLGAMWVPERRVRVDSSLDPTRFSEKEGRYRFTVGHEIGHWQLHRHLFLADVNQPMLFGASPEPSVICRSGPRKEPIEWQADAFAARLLMPKGMMARTWEEMRGHTSPHFADDRDEPVSVVNRRHLRADPTEAIACEMARTFCVSPRAMGIRLREVGLIRVHGKWSSLFG